jgi:hypothetical protein
MRCTGLPTNFPVFGANGTLVAAVCDRRCLGNRQLVPSLSAHRRCKLPTKRIYRQDAAKVDIQTRKPYFCNHSGRVANRWLEGEHKEGVRQSGLASKAGTVSPSGPCEWRENEAPFRFTHSHVIRADRCGERSLPTTAHRRASHLK